jgi:uncharacterized protein YecT (DUF1311 family)
MERVRDRKGGKVKHWALVTFGFLLVSINANAQGPACSDTRTLQLVQQIFLDTIDQKAAGFPIQDLGMRIKALITVNIRTVRTANIDRSIGKYFCEGTLEVKLPQSTATLLSSPHAQSLLAQDPQTRSIRISKDAASVGIRFASQLTDNKREHHVEASGFQTLADLVFQFTAQEVEEQLAASPPGKDAPKARTITKADDSKKEEDGPEKTGPCKGLDLAITADLRDCLARQFKAADESLNSTYKNLMAKIDDEQKRRLRESQRAWIKQKESKCAKAGEEMKGGTMEPIMIADCHLQMTEQRVSYLKSYRP